MTDKPDAAGNQPSGPQSMGHEWDGIEELDNPLPRWWLWVFYGCIVFAIGYCVVYPAIPLANRATHGLWAWSSRGEFAIETAAVDKSRAAIRDELARTPIERIDPNSPLMRAAIEGGRAAFKVHCVQCHGSGAAGSRGYPNLNDDDWLWGGDLASIRQTIEHGARQPGDEDTRVSQMPAFGRDGMLTRPEIDDLVSFVRVVSRQERADAASQRGALLFEANCAVCHGPDAKGGRMFGAPNLADAIWLYGSDREALGNTITNARAGVMPAWGGRLDPATVNMLAAYVHSLGGGE